MKYLNEKTSDSLTMYIKNQIELITVQLEQLESIYERMQNETIQNNRKKPNTLLTIKECTERYHNLTDYTLRKWIRSGKIKAERAGEGENGKYLIIESSLEDALSLRNN